MVKTVGLVPPETRQARLKEMKEIADFAKLLGCNVVALHLGFVPHDTKDPLYAEVVGITRQLCDHVKTNGQNLHLETGQETAAGLVQFIHDVGRDNLFVNFDPANMILYGTGEPIAAVKQIGKVVRSIHCKDGKWAANPGKEWGRSSPARPRGRRDGDHAVLLEIGYDGPLTIEREIPQEPDRQKAENPGGAVKLLSDLKAKLGVG